MLCERSSLGALYGVLRPGPIKGTSTCDKWRLNLALTFVMSEQQLVSIVRRYLPSQQIINRAEGLATIGFGAAELAGIALAAHDVDMMTAGRRAWNTGRPPQTRTERVVRAVAPKGTCAPLLLPIWQVRLQMP